MNHRYLLIILLIALVTITSCSEDDEKAPNYEMEFVDICSDASSLGRTMITDDGTTFTINNPFTQMVADTTYRYVVVFVKQSPTQVTISSSVKALAGNPSMFEKTPFTDYPVSLQSIWRGSSYINLVLNVWNYNGKHQFGFKTNGIITESDGHKLLHLHLYHNNGDDTEAFTSKVYLSCRLHNYEDSLQHNRDSIIFTINDRDRGLTDYPLPY